MIHILHTITVGDGAFIHKIDYVGKLYEILILKGIPIAILFQEIGRFCKRGGFCLALELHQEGSVPAACVAGLFLQMSMLYVVGILVLLNNNTSII